MKKIETHIPGIFICEPHVHQDQRGFFYEMFNQKTLESLGIKRSWIQDNYSRSSQGVLRGLHWQIHNPQAKLVSVLQGNVFDVAVDMRKASPTFSRWVGVELSSENKKMLFIPEGCAHGFLVLSEYAEFFYKCSEYYDPQNERGLIWNDARVAIQWPMRNIPPVLSRRDALWGSMDQLKDEDFL